MTSQRYEWDLTYYKKNKVKIDKYRKNWRIKNREMLIQKHKEYWIKFYSNPKNREKERKRQKEHREKNPSRVSEWQKKNPEKFRKIQKRYYMSDKGKARFKNAYSLRKKTKFKITKEKLKKAFDKTGGKCPYCEDKITIINFSLDHIKPISRQGTNHLNNLIACCNMCNSIKKDRSVKVFLKKIRV